jgi:hypothetical protein
MSSLRARVRTVALAGGLGLASLGVLSYSAVVSPPAAQADEKTERHPHIRKALVELKEARKELKEADHDFSGHRVEAIKAIDVAIKQLDKALEYDRK